MRRVGSSRGFAIRGAFIPFSRAIRFAVATRPTARSGPATVVRDGVLSTEISVLSKPTTATSCGTRTPESLACCMKPSATMSLKQITASVRSFAHSSNARRPPTKSGESTEIVFIFGFNKCFIRPGCTVTLREIEIALVDATPPSTAAASEPAPARGISPGFIRSGDIRDGTAPLIHQMHHSFRRTVVVIHHHAGNTLHFTAH